MYELEDLDGTLNKNCIYTPSELRMKRDISSQCTRLVVTFMEREAQDGLKLSSKGWEVFSGFKAGGSTPWIASIGKLPKEAHEVRIVVLKNISRMIKPTFPNFKDKCTEFWR